ncbi:MAG: TAXI family TRAP transporter solute-binding subunit, partial [Sneathiella sp.]
RGFSHPYPVLLTTAEKSEDDVYNLIKGISENLDAIQAHTPSAEGWNLSWQNLTWVMPYHKGAIRYFQEVGIWSDAAQAHQNKLIRRQAALIKAFKDFKATNPEEDSFVSGWRYIREITLAE